jgi:hypothetical protein
MVSVWFSIRARDKTMSKPSARASVRAWFTLGLGIGTGLVLGYGYGYG